MLLPLLTTIALLCVDYGRFAHSYIAVTNAAREGATVGAFNPVTPTTRPLWEAAIRRAVEDELDDNSWFDPSQLTMATPRSVDEGNGLRRVEVDVSYAFQTLINWPFLPGYNRPYALRRIVVMRAVR